MRHREIIPTDDHQTGHPNRRVAAQINLRQDHWPLIPRPTWRVGYDELMNRPAPA